MCLAPKLIINRHYLKICDNDKSRALSLFGGAPDFFVKVDCTLCIECQKKRGKQWRTRLLDEYQYYIEKYPKSNVHFCTLTISPEFYHLFSDNGSSKRMIRLFLERYRKRYGRSFRHFIVSEYGEKRGRLHFHMLSFGMLCNYKELNQLWKYGRVDMQTLCGPAGITYLSGYLTKVVKDGSLSDASQPFFISSDKKTFVCVSPGFGKLKALDYSVRESLFNGKYPRTVFVRDGVPYAIPRYYRDKLFSPVDLARMKRDYLLQSQLLPRPPYRVHNRQFDDLQSYALRLLEIGGIPTLLPSQYDKLPKFIKPLFNNLSYGK